MKHVLLFAFALIISFSTTVIDAQAAQPQLTGTHGDWLSYVFNDDSGKVCYMASRPVDAQGDYTKRGEIFALLTHRPSEGSKNVFSYLAGYTYKSGSEVTIKVNGQTFTLFTQGDTAWTPDAETDNRLANAIKKGSEMVVKGTSSRGTLTTDTISLKGSGDAHKKISQECGM